MAPGHSRSRSADPAPTMAPAKKGTRKSTRLEKQAETKAPIPHTPETTAPKAKKAKKTTNKTAISQPTVPPTPDDSSPHLPSAAAQQFKMSLLEQEIGEHNFNGMELFRAMWKEWNMQTLSSPYPAGTSMLDLCLARVEYADLKKRIEAAIWGKLNEKTDKHGRCEVAASVSQILKKHGSSLPGSDSACTLLRMYGVFGDALATIRLIRGVAKVMEHFKGHWPAAVHELLKHQGLRLSGEEKAKGVDRTSEWVPKDAERALERLKEAEEQSEDEDDTFESNGDTTEDTSLSLTEDTGGASADTTAVSGDPSNTTHTSAENNQLSDAPGADEDDSVEGPSNTSHAQAGVSARRESGPRMPTSKSQGAVTSKIAVDGQRRATQVSPGGADEDQPQSSGAAPPDDEDDDEDDSAGRTHAAKQLSSRQRLQDDDLDNEELEDDDGHIQTSSKTPVKSKEGPEGPIEITSSSPWSSPYRSEEDDSYLVRVGGKATVNSKTTMTSKTTVKGKGNNGEDDNDEEEDDEEEDDEEDGEEDDDSDAMDLTQVARGSGIQTNIHSANNSTAGISVREPEMGRRQPAVDDMSEFPQQDFTPHDGYDDDTHDFDDIDGPNGFVEDNKSSSPPPPPSPTPRPRKRDSPGRLTPTGTDTAAARQTNKAAMKKAAERDFYNFHFDNNSSSTFNFHRRHQHRPPPPYVLDDSASFHFPSPELHHSTPRHAANMPRSTQKKPANEPTPQPPNRFASAVAGPSDSNRGKKRAAGEDIGIPLVNTADADSSFSTETDLQRRGSRHKNDDDATLPMAEIEQMQRVLDVFSPIPHLNAHFDAAVIHSFTPAHGDDNEEKQDRLTSGSGTITGVIWMQKTKDWAVLHIEREDKVCVYMPQHIIAEGRRNPTPKMNEDLDHDLQHFFTQVEAAGFFHFERDAFTSEEASMGALPEIAMTGDEDVISQWSSLRCICTALCLFFGKEVPKFVTAETWLLLRQICNDQDRFSRPCKPFGALKCDRHFARNLPLNQMPCPSKKQLEHTLPITLACEVPVKLLADQTSRAMGSMPDLHGLRSDLSHLYDDNRLLMWLLKAAKELLLSRPPEPESPSTAHFRQAIETQTNPARRKEMEALFNKTNGPRQAHQEFHDERLRLHDSLIGNIAVDRAEMEDVSRDMREQLVAMENALDAAAEKMLQDARAIFQRAAAQLTISKD